jgi:hypothetical protein
MEYILQELEELVDDQAETIGEGRPRDKTAFSRLETKSRLRNIETERPR